MERSTPVRKPHASTADLLTWSETPPPDSPAVGSASRSTRSHQPSDGIRVRWFGSVVTEEEFESLNKRKPCSGYKMKEMTGSGIFAANGENDLAESDSANPTSNSKTGLRMYQHNRRHSFAEKKSVLPKSSTTSLLVAKQRELSGTLESESDAMLKQISSAKSKELSGHDIFAPPPEILPRPTTVRALALQESIQLGNNVFKVVAPPSTAEKRRSVAKLREMSGSDIFADGKAESRDYLGGVRKPPGGESSIALV
uniref:DUF4057 domain-containing protein n=1 Tax=Salix viminalis TaxID=40686 RepID=A0A6N2MYU4_SALVM